MHRLVAETPGASCAAIAAQASAPTAMAALQRRLRCKKAFSRQPSAISRQVGRIAMRPYNIPSACRQAASGTAMKKARQPAELHPPTLALLVNYTLFASALTRAPVNECPSLVLLTFSISSTPMLSHPPHPVNPLTATLGDEGTRTPVLRRAKAPLSHLSYVPATAPQTHSQP